jgi:LysM repeat protein
MHALVVKGVVVAAALAGSVLGVTQSQSVEAAVQAGMVDVQVVIPTYIVEPGDTLSLIAGKFCGSINDYPALASANHIANPNVIDVGWVIKLSCKMYTHVTYAQQPVQGGDSVAAVGQANIPGTVPSVYSFYGLEKLWVSVGGNPADQGTAACIAEHESGGRTYAVSPTNDYGLWQIHNGGAAMFNPIANAETAVRMSANGTNWGDWTTAPDCGV